MDNHTDEGNGRLLAVDLGMKAGLAWFTTDGMLLRARSTRFPSRTVLRRALRTLWDEVPGVTTVVIEGGGELADIWADSARAHGLTVASVTAETWRAEMLLTRQRRSGRQAKATAEYLAMQLARQSGHSPRTAFNDDTAEAVLCGAWYISCIRRQSS